MQNNNNNKTNKKVSADTDALNVGVLFKMQNNSSSNETKQE